TVGPYYYDLYGFPPRGVLHNDSDPDLDGLTARLRTSPQHGSLQLNDDGTFTYTPNPAYLGFDSFSYTAFDGAEDSDPAVVTLNVSDDIIDNIPDAPPGGVPETKCRCDCGCDDDDGEPGDLVQSVPGAQGNIPEQDTADPVRYADGVAQIVGSDLSS